MNRKIYAHALDMKGFSVKNCPSMPGPSALLMCSPAFYDVSAVRNPYMARGIGKVDKTKALEQWNTLKETFELLGRPIKTIDPVEGFEDMVFASSQAFTGLTTQMQKVCLLSHMCHPVRKGEVQYFEKWFRDEGYKVVALKDEALKFEGQSDAVWHPGKRVIWGGHGFRTDFEVYEEVVNAFETPVIALKLVNERFFYLSSCFCPLNSEAVLIYPPAFAPDSLELILRMFPIVLAADEKEVSSLLPCSAAVIDSTAVIQKGAENAARHMRAIGLKVTELETSEFLKSGGSAVSLKMNLY